MFFFFNDTATTEIYTLSLHDALPIYKKRNTIKLGSYSAIERLIRIHPTLDAEWVPRYFVSYIVYHELLHHVVPALRSSGRTDRKSTRLNSSHANISYAVFCLKKKKTT